MANDSHGPVPFEQVALGTKTAQKASTDIAQGPGLTLYTDGTIAFDNNIHDATTGIMSLRRIYISNDDSYANASINIVGRGSSSERIRVDVPPAMVSRFRQLVGNDAADRVWGPSEIAEATALGEAVFATVTPETVAAQEAQAAAPRDVMFERITENRNGERATYDIASTDNIFNPDSLQITPDGSIHYGQTRDDVDTSLHIGSDNTVIVTVRETRGSDTSTHDFELTGPDIDLFRRALGDDNRDRRWSAEEISEAEELTAPLFRDALARSREGNTP